MNQDGLPDIIGLLDGRHPLQAEGRPLGRYEQLLAIREHWSDSLISLPSLGVVIGALLAILAGLWLWQAWRSRRLGSAPLLSFHRIASAAGLGLADQWLLLRIARAEGLASPLTLLLCDTTLGHHGRRYLATLTAPRRTTAARRLRRINRRLFQMGGAAPVPEGGPSCHQ